MPVVSVVLVAPLVPVALRESRVTAVPAAQADWLEPLVTVVSGL